MSDILNKIKALRAKATNEASTEAEMQEAAKLVAKLMTKHDVSEADLSETERPRYRGAHANMGKVKHDLQVCRERVAWSVQNLTGTKFWMSDRGQVINCAGVDHDVEMAVYLMEMITMTAKREWRMYSASLFDEEGITRTKDRRPSFYASFAIRASAMLDELADTRTKATGTALVVSKKEIIDAELADLGVRIGGTHRSKNVTHSPHAAEAGRKAASRMNLNRPFQGANSAKLSA